MALQQYQDNLTSKIARQEEVLMELSQKLEVIQKEIRWDKQRLNDQGQLAKEVRNWLTQGRKLMEDMCGCFEKEALQDIVIEVQEIVEEVSQNYTQIQEQYTYLLRETIEIPTQKKIGQEKSEESNVIEIQPEEIDGMLTPEAITRRIKDFSNEELEAIAKIVGSTANTPTGVAKALANKNLKKDLLLALIENALAQVHSSRDGISGQLAFA